MSYTGEEQYLNLLRKAYEEGEWIENERTGTSCKTIINYDMEYDCSSEQVPVVTTRKVGIKLPIAELLGYIRGYTDASDFEKIGTKTWYANANENASWLANPNRKGENDMGLVYGAVARNWPKPDGTTIDLISKVYNNLRQGKDDRGETITFWNPGLFEYGCLRPCLKEHTFSVVNGTLYLTSIQRSSDICLGTVANMVQVYVLLRLMAQITGLKPGKAFHKNINAHIYDNQYPLVHTQLERTPFAPPKLWINPEIKTLEDLETWVTVDDFKLIDYKHHERIDYPFSV